MLQLLSFDIDFWRPRRHPRRHPRRLRIYYFVGHVIGRERRRIVKIKGSEW
jgi:hypothetical protein